MVQLSLVRFCLMKAEVKGVRPATARKQKWIDSLRICCKGGHGGNGLQKYGGCGGQGGNVVFRAVDVIKSSKTRSNAKLEELKSLYTLFKREFEGDPKKQKASGETGQDSTGYKIIGSGGKDFILDVPAGVSLKDDAGKIICQLNEAGDRTTVVIGGAGGSPTNGWLGQPGTRRNVRLDFKLIADAGLVGFPNAGKSTLLKAISRANPKIAAYPFTTIKPNLGKLVYDDHREMTIADLPGLIEGAHYNVGMGHRFLKHVERTSLLVFVVDVQGFQLRPHLLRRTAYETMALLVRELELYNPDVLLKPAVCLVNKMDTEGSHEKLEQNLRFVADSATNSKAGLEGLDVSMHPERHVNFREVIPMSAKFNKKDVLRVKDRLRNVMDECSQEENQIDEVVIGASDKLDLMINDNAPRVY